MDKIELINSLIEDTRKVKEEAKHFATLSQGELLYKPSPEQWSVLECIEHLNIADAHYIRQFDKKLPNATESDIATFNPGWMGNYFVKMMKPRTDGSIPSPMKTMKKFIPEINVQYDTLSKFIEDQDYLIEALERSKSLNLNKIKISSAIGSIVTFKLGDAFRFLIGHNQRHMLQAQHVLEQLEVLT